MSVAAAFIKPDRSGFLLLSAQRVKPLPTTYFVIMFFISISFFLNLLVANPVISWLGSIWLVIFMYSLLLFPILNLVYFLNKKRAIKWFGFGMTSKVVITALVCFFPLLESTITAIQSSDKQKQELFKMMGATRLQTLIHLKIPAGMPGILAGLRVSVVLAVVGAVVGEFIGGSEGLGALIIATQAMMDTPLMFSALILLTIFGMILYLIVSWFEKKWSKRYQKEI